MELVVFWFVEGLGFFRIRSIASECSESERKNKWGRFTPDAGSKTRLNPGLLSYHPSVIAQFSEAGGKAPGDWRTPGRWRVQLSASRWRSFWSAPVPWRFC